MSGDIRERIADVLSKHDCWDYAGALQCRCDEDFVGDDDQRSEQKWAAHVADVLATELGLTQGWFVPTARCLRCSR